MLIRPLASFPTVLLSALLVGASVSYGQRLPLAPTAAPDPLAPAYDSLRLRQYQTRHVQRMVKLRLRPNGTVADTVEVVELDRQGRLVRWRSPAEQAYRRWNYDSQGRCTTLVARPPRVDSRLRPGWHWQLSYAPAERRVRTELWQSPTRQQLAQEWQTTQRGDTSITAATTYPLSADAADVTQPGHERILSYAGGPDTVLLLRHTYDDQHQLRRAETSYFVRRQGRLLETGELRLPGPPRPISAPEAVLPPPPRYVSPHLLAQLPKQFTWRTRRRFDAQGRLSIEQQVPLLFQEGLPGNASDALYYQQLSYRYDEQHQLVGQQETAYSSGQPQNTSYTVYTCSPEGLPEAESVSAFRQKTRFFAYRYAFHH